MTEAEWLAAIDPEPMMSALRGIGADRKLRLFAVACCKRMLCVMQVQESAVRAVDTAERFADGKAQPEELCGPWPWQSGPASAWHACLNCTETEDPIGMADAAAGNASWATAAHTRHPKNDPSHPPFKARLATEQAIQSTLLRCIFGNPFRPVTFAPSWGSETAVALAAGIYDERAFDRLPILTDALEEAGCDHPDVLNHLRGPGPHARGCWVVDGVLGKS